MTERFMGFDRASIDKISEDETWLMAEAVIASEIVQQYPNGMAYKPADELEKATWTADGRWVTILKHPETALLERASDVYGKIENPIFVKNLQDIKTKRPNRRGIRALIKWRKDKVPEALQTQIKTLKMRDASIGFTYEEDRTPGEWEGQHYDYIQRNIFIDHLAAPIEQGRCPSPLCGIGVDSIVKVAGDPWEETEENIRSGHREPGETCRTIEISESEGIKAIYCKYGEKWDVQSFLFDKGKWTMDRAKAWFEKHKGDSIHDAEQECPICQAIREVGLLTSAKRLAIAYGADIIKVIKDAEPSKPEEHKDDLSADFQHTFGELASKLQK